MSSSQLNIPELYSQLSICKKNCITFQTNWNTAVQKLRRTLTGSMEYDQLLHSINLYKILLQKEREEMRRLIKLVDDINAKELDIISGWIAETEKPLPSNKPPPKPKSPYNRHPISIKVNQKKEEKKEESEKDEFDDPWPEVPTPEAENSHENNVVE